MNEISGPARYNFLGKSKQLYIPGEGDKPPAAGIITVVMGTMGRAKMVVEIRRW